MEPTDISIARLRKRWVLPIYAFYKKTVKIEYVDGRRSHVFTCAGKTCDFTTCRFLDTKDRSTGNLLKHTLGCWGEEAVQRARKTANQDEARRVVVNSILHTGSVRIRGVEPSSHRSQLR